MPHLDKVATDHIATDHIDSVSNKGCKEDNEKSEQQVHDYSLLILRFQPADLRFFFMGPETRPNPVQRCPGTPGLLGAVPPDMSWIGITYVVAQVLVVNFCGLQPDSFQFFLNGVGRNGSKLCSFRALSNRPDVSG